MSWAGIVGGAISLLMKLLDYLGAREASNSVTHEVTINKLQEDLDALKATQKARRDVRDRLAIDPTSVWKSRPEDRPYDPNATG